MALLDERNSDIGSQLKSSNVREEEKAKEITTLRARVETLEADVKVKNKVCMSETKAYGMLKSVDM